MKALMLAAGLGRRLYGDENLQSSKALLIFNEQTLLHRHINILISFGIKELIMVVGHKKEEIFAEVEKVAPKGFVSFLYNPRYREGPKLSLAAAKETLLSGCDLIFMDADILYHSKLMERVVKSEYRDCLAMDRGFQSSDDFVKICIKDNQFSDFGKKIDSEYDYSGEWPGIFKMSSEVAKAIADKVGNALAEGREEGDYEEIFKDAMASFPSNTFGIEDVSDVPWVEIDFEADLNKAKNKIMPLLDWDKFK